VNLALDNQNMFFFIHRTVDKDSQIVGYYSTLQFSQKPVCRNDP